ncbi:MAG: 5-formyltetrahydrofolate cyclo-ligase [Niabella sp.]
MLKSEARKIFAQKRKTITPQQRNRWNDLVLIQFQNISLPPVHTLFTYAATDTEVSTDAIVDYLHFQNPGMQIAYPFSDFETSSMQAIKVTAETLFIINKYKIPEPETGTIIFPEDIDVVIMPMLCFDKEGYRVGYGKGFYDKYLEQVREDVIKVGLCYYEPIDKIDDRNKFDVPLDYCVTPERTYEF